MLIVGHAIVPLLTHCDSIVSWIDRDPRNPMLYSAVVKWSVMMIVAMAALMVSLDSSAYSGAADEIMKEFGCSEETYVLGISLFVLGFAVVSAPKSQRLTNMYCRDVTDFPFS